MIIEFILITFIYRPAFLLAAGEELPQKIIAHAHWTVNRKKMSKSLGNVINPLDLISGANSITVDEFRYFLLREGGIVDDGDFNLEQLYNRITSELSNQYGNLIARSLSPAINPSHLYPSNESLISLDESEKNIITQIDLLLRLFRIPTDINFVINNEKSGSTKIF